MFPGGKHNRETLRDRVGFAGRFLWRCISGSELRRRPGSRLAIAPEKHTLKAAGIRMDLDY
jgi:hypothetical protein